VKRRSYGEIAADIGAPRAARAVGPRACASNRLAVMVPCHRVIREDGSLGGLRWGIARKRGLLARDRKWHRDGHDGWCYCEPARPR
jgi:AraC family transcriptional regulator of adaptative response/methylated-DNA-[protein]-cysteine methyltransferase